MKKSSLLFASALSAIFVGVSSAYAIDVTNSANRTWDMNVTTNQNVTTIQLKTDSDAGLEVRANEEVILDLNGHKLTNYCAKNEVESGCTGASATIAIEKGGKLTITDTSSGETKGTVTQKAQTENMIAIDNKGTLIVEDGNITGINGVGKDGSYSVILNQGTMEVKGGVITSSDGQKSAAIHNLGTITISGGEIKTGVEDSWGLLNYGTATISDGTFTQGFKYSVIQNSGTMTIEDGTFKTTSEDGYALITNENVYNTANTGNAILEINGGDFTSDIVLSYGTSKKGEAVINGGTYDTTQDMTSFIANDSTIDEDGNVVKKEIHKIEVKEDDNATIEVSKDSTYEGDTVEVNVEVKDGYKLSEIVVETKSGEKIEVKDGSFIMPDEDVTISVSLQNIDSSSSVPSTNTDASNPETLDNISVYFAISAIAVSTVALCGYLLIKKRFED